MEKLLSILENRYYYTTRKRKFIYHDCFLYDIRQCAFRILKNLGYNDLYNELIKIKDKNERMFQLGSRLKNNKSVLKTINRMTLSIIRKFIIDNKIKEDDVILIQKDGLLLSKYIDVSIYQDNEIYPELRSVYDYIVLSADKKQILYKKDNQTIITKGIQNKSIGLDRFLTEQLYNVQLTNFKKINKLIYNFFNSNDISLFAIKNKYKDKYYIYMKDEILEIDSTLINLIEIESEGIDKHYYFSLYLENIFRGILIDLTR